MNLIVAVNSDWGIGYNGTQSIVLPEDRLHFQKLTTGGIIIAGRKTFEDFGRPLPNRVNIIMSHNMNFRADGIIVAHSVDEVLATISDYTTESIYIIGGGSIYNLFLPMCTRAYVTSIKAAPPSDTYITNLDESPNWTLDNRGETIEHHGIWYSFDEYINSNPIF